MCYGNLAQASAHYLNAQLGALWDNAFECNKTEGPGKVPTDNAVKYGIALREFHGPNTKDGRSTTFHAVFGKAPQLEFVCNHELVLYLEIESGHYETSGSVNNINNATLAIRLSYNVQVVDVALSGCTTSISIVAIEPASANLIIGSSSSVSTSFFSLVKAHYLPTLVRAGSTSLFELPPSYTSRPAIDHSLLVDSKSIMSRDFLFDVELDKVNEVLGHYWLSAIGHGNDYSSPSELRDTYLSEYRTWWHSSDGLKLWVCCVLNPLRVQVLCEKEVILFVTANVDFYYSDEEDHIQNNKDSSYENWQVAIVFQVSKDQGRIVLDRSITPRVLPNLCDFPSANGEDEDSLIESQEAFKDVILHQYIKLIFEYGHHQLYPDFTPVIGGSPGNHIGPKPEPYNWPPVRPKHPKIPYCPIDSDKFTINWPDMWDKFTEETSLHGYHHITSVTQAGINARFIAMWKAAIAASPDKRLAVLARFSSKGREETVDMAHLPHFEAEFGPPQIELGTVGGGNSVILYFYIQKISFMLESSVHQFNDWILAFEFDLSLIDIPLGTVTTEGTGLAKLQQLVLNINTAKLRHERSSFAGLADTKFPTITRQLYGNLSKTFIKRYLAAFDLAQYHILYTIPVHSHDRMKARPNVHARPHAATKFGFAIVPFSLQSFKGRIFQGLCGSTHHIIERNMIVFYGIVGEGELHGPPKSGPYGAPSEDPPHGNLLLSGESFLKVLAKVNAFSTILCRIDGVEEGKWDVRLMTWKDRKRSEDSCDWDLNSPQKSDGRVKYDWFNKEEWDYDPDGKIGRVGKYTATAHTKNSVAIPTTGLDGPVTIILEGSSTIGLGLVENGTENWHGVSKASWKATLKFVSDPVNGLSLIVKEPATVTFEKYSNKYTDDVFEICEKALTNVFETLKAVFGTKIDLSGTLEDVNRSFSGVYQGLCLPYTELVLANPVFNDRGNLFLQLLPKSEVSAVPKETTSEQGSNLLKPGSQSSERRVARRAASRAALREPVSYNPPSLSTMTMPPKLYNNAPTPLTPSPSNTLTPLDPPKYFISEAPSDTNKFVNGVAPDTAPKNGLPVFGDTKAVASFPPPVALASAVA